MVDIAPIGAVAWEAAKRTYPSLENWDFSMTAIAKTGDSSGYLMHLKNKQGSDIASAHLEFTSTELRIATKQDIAAIIYSRIEGMINQKVDNPSSIDALERVIRHKMSDH